MRASRDGFTLVELLVSVSLLMLLSGVTVLSVSGLMEGYRLKQAQVLYAGAVREAQLNAYRYGESWRVRVDPGGGGALLEKATGVRSDCATSGWSLVRTLKFDQVSLTGDNRSCVVFGPTGRSSVPSPMVTNADVANYCSTCVNNAFVLVDGNKVLPYNPESPWDSPSTIKWEVQSPTVSIVLDAGESRIFANLEVGFFSEPSSGYDFPAEIQLRGQTTDPYNPAQMQCIGDFVVDTSSGAPVLVRKTVAENLDGCPAEDLAASDPIPTECPDPAVCRFSIPVHGSYRHFELTVTPISGNNLVIDEIDFGDLTFTLSIGDKSRTVSISPVTGRVTIR